MTPCVCRVPHAFDLHPKSPTTTNISIHPRSDRRVALSLLARIDSVHDCKVAFVSEGLICTW